MPYGRPHHDIDRQVANRFPCPDDAMYDLRRRVAEAYFRDPVEALPISRQLDEHVLWATALMMRRIRSHSG